MRFATLQGEYAKSVLSSRPALEGIDSLVLVETDEAGVARVLLQSDAVLRIAAYLGGGWRLFGVFRLVPRPLRDWAYSVFARFRYRLFGRYDACPLPAPEVLDRFID